MKGRTPTADEQRWLDAIVDIGCIVCREVLGVYSPAEPHHLDGKTKPGAHFKAIPICPPHHRLPCPHGTYATRHGPGRMAGKKQFEMMYGTELELLERVRDLIDQQPYSEQQIWQA